MRNQNQKSEARVLVGTGYPSGTKDIAEAGPIPESAGIQVRPEALSSPPETSPPPAKPERKSP